ncbi:MAG: prevent-host-death protein [Deltaproteobacteria bacterium]|nr:prevent-host-death protein [Deltaproteobacteria bacterium]MDZ4347467.1 prevent-host-death protein [Candidatus Binatia bacterium]
MKVTGIRELRARTAVLLGSGEPVLVTKHGKVSGVYVPLDEPDRLPDDLRRELTGVVGKHLTKALERKGVAERDVKEDFRAYRRRRR